MNLPDLLKRLEDAAKAYQNYSGPYYGHAEVAREFHSIANPQTTLALIAIVRELRGALEYYAKAERLKDAPEGYVEEIGCSCCTGIVDKDGCVSYEEGIVGHRSRQALTRADELAKEINAR